MAVGALRGLSSRLTLRGRPFFDWAGPVLLVAVLPFSFGSLHPRCSQHSDAARFHGAGAARVAATPARSTALPPAAPPASLTEVPADDGPQDLDDDDGDDVTDGLALHSGGPALRHGVLAVTVAAFPRGGPASNGMPRVLGGPGAPRGPPVRRRA